MTHVREGRAREGQALPETRALLREGLALQQQQERPYLIAESLEIAAELAAAQGDAARAARLLGAAGALRETMGAPLPLGLRTGVDRAAARARSLLADAAFHAALAGGAAMALDHAVAEALAAAD